MQNLYVSIKNFVFANLMAFLTLIISSISVAIILLWATLLILWSGVDFSGNQVFQIVLITGTVVATIVVAVAVLYFLNRTRLDRARAQAIELELARNLVTINGYRQAIIDLEKVSNGK